MFSEHGKEFNVDEYMTPTIIGSLSYADGFNFVTDMTCALVAFDATMLELLLKGVSGVYILTNGHDILEGSSAGYVETLEKDLADLRSKDIDAEVASGGRRMYVSTSEEEQEASVILEMTLAEG
ncbi:2,3-bisphosphoglycerate-independent phosphoglycerate mutase [Tanacetum coccineum]